MTTFGQLMLLFSTFGQVMLPYPDGRSKMFNGFMVVVALKMDSLCFLFGQLMVQVTVADGSSPSTVSIIYI